MGDGRQASRATAVLLVTVGLFVFGGLLTLSSSSPGWFLFFLTVKINGWWRLWTGWALKQEMQHFSEVTNYSTLAPGSNEAINHKYELIKYLSDTVMALKQEGEHLRGCTISHLMSKPQILQHTHVGLGKSGFAEATVNVGCLCDSCRQRKYKEAVNATHICVFKAKKILQIFFCLFFFFHQRPFLDPVGAWIMWKDGDPSGQTVNFTSKIPLCCAHSNFQSI